MGPLVVLPGGRSEALEAELDRAAGPARSATSSGDSPQKLPRLVLRFAVYTAIGLAFAAGAILLFVRSYVTSQAESSVRYHARFAAEVGLGDRLRRADFEAPTGSKRRAALDQLFASRVLLDGAVRALLVSPDGRVTYASERSLIGRTAPNEGDVRRALHGTSVRSAVADVRMRNGSTRKVLRVFVPVRFDRSSPAGVFVLDQDYAPIARAAREAFIPIAGVLQLVLLALYISLFPILRKVTERLRRQLHDIEHQALHDGLTGLPNRRLFGDRIEQALAWARRNGSGVAVMLIDLDRFKHINDTLGHQSGDALLQELGSRLRGLLRETDTIARLGGDEFGVVLPLDTQTRVLDIVERIRAAIERPFVLQGLVLRVGASIGVAFFPRDGEDAETLTKRADVAMYLAKESGTGHELYETDRDANDAGRLTLASELRGALDDGQLLLHFQPKVAIDDGRIESVEALVRWDHPERGLLPPADFVPLAEETGLIKPLTTHVLDAALARCREWEDAGVAVRVAVNVDVRSLLEQQFADEVIELLAKWKLDPARLELEITEGTIMADRERVRRVAERLRDLGVQLSIDDFGTGYSSLGYLRTLPVAELKIDRSFVAQMTEDESVATIVRSMADLGRNLGLRVVAEGVETKAAWDRLEEFGCSFGQGFYLARPAPAEETLQRLRAATKRRGKHARSRSAAAKVAGAAPVRAR